MSSGLKNLQSASRACSRRERLESGSLLPHDPHNPGAYTDDSGIGIDDLEAEYSADGAGGYSPETDTSGGRLTNLSGNGYEQHTLQPQHQHHMMHDQGHGMGQQLQRPQYGLQQRLPSIDMGIGAIINRPPGGN